MSPLSRYRDLVSAGVLAPDAAQADAAARLQALAEALERPSPLLSRLFARPETPRGVYLWGGVGRGKSLLMDIFFNNTRVDPKRRVHFHEFMAETHDRIAAWRGGTDAMRRRHPGVNRKSPGDPMPPVARDIAVDARLLCFDEFQVSDIADAMILGRLFEALFSEGVVVVATSNRPPDDLYRDGLNRQLFSPFITLLKSRVDVVELKSARDFRLERLGGAPVYHAPLSPEADDAMDASWTRYICDARERNEEISVKGRRVAVPRAARGAARFSFADLCEAPLGAADYLAIARRYDAVFVDRVPRLGPEKRNEAKRFVTLVDALYEARTKLICSADAEPDALYATGDGAFEFARAASRLMEMRSADYLGLARLSPKWDESVPLGKERNGSGAALPQGGDQLDA